MFGQDSVRGTVWGGAEEKLCGTMNAKLNTTEKTGVG